MAIAGGFGDDGALRRLLSGEDAGNGVIRGTEGLNDVPFGSSASGSETDRNLELQRAAAILKEYAQANSIIGLAKGPFGASGTSWSAEMARLEHSGWMARPAGHGSAPASLDYASPVGATLITAKGVLDELERFYGLAHAQHERDAVWRLISSAGSLGGLATDLARRSEAATARDAALYAAAQAGLGRSAGLAVLRNELRHSYPEIFPALRSPSDVELAATVEAAMGHDLLAPYPDWRASAIGHLASVTVPWVREDSPEQSILAMSRFEVLIGLSTLLPPGDPNLGAALRFSLGDYREAPPPPTAVADEPVARVGYLIERGFDRQLSELTPAIVGVMFSPIVSGTVMSAEPDPEQVEAAVRRMLKRIEGDLRRFIQGRLQALAGDGWYRRIPAKVRGELERRADVDRSNGRQPEPQLAYADFDDYRRIIESPANWEEIFAAVFGEPVFIRETLRRIAVVRNPCQHFRTVTVEDMVTLRAELVHLGRWIGSNPLTGYGT